MAKKFSVAIIGEGETEWFYFDALRVAERYPFSMKPTFPKHSDWKDILKKGKECLDKGFDRVFCLIDMDVLKTKPSELQSYEQSKKRRDIKGIDIIETNPCTEFWFLLHFLPEASTRAYQSYDALLPELRKYLPDYEKSKKYFQKNNLYTYLKEYGDLERAMTNAEKLSILAQDNPEDGIAYSQIYKILQTLRELKGQ